jgi:hypothetical protein
MALQITFALSGAVIVAIILAKLREDRSKRKPAFLRLISLGDERARTLSHELAHRYTELKDEADFFINKELPFKTRNFVNRTNQAIKERFDKYVGDIRGSRLMKRPDGLNEFYKSLSEKENGRIDETMDVSGEPASAPTESELSSEEKTQ